MAIPQTAIHAGRIVDQIVVNLVNLQRDMRSNAQAWRTAALAQARTLNELNTFAADAGQQYLRRLQWVNDLLNDAARHAALSTALSLRGWNDADVTAVLTPLHDAVIAYRDASRTSYAEIIVACDAMIATVQAPDSLWPE